MVETAPRLILVTGAPGSGKTTAVRRALGLLAASGVRARACLSEAVERTGEGLSLGFDLAFYDTPGPSPAAGALEAAFRLPLARRPPPESGDGPLRERMKPFTFYPEAFIRAEAFLSGAAADVAAVDEIGPLELDSGGGFSPVLRAWAGGKTPRTVLATVRPALAGKLRALLTGAPVIQTPAVSVVSLDELSIEDAAREIAALCWGPIRSR